MWSLNMWNPSELYKIKSIRSTVYIIAAASFSDLDYLSLDPLKYSDKNSSLTCFWSLTWLIKSCSSTCVIVPDQLRSLASVNMQIRFSKNEWVRQRDIIF